MQPGLRAGCRRSANTVSSLALPAAALRGSERPAQTTECAPERFLIGCRHVAVPGPQVSVAMNAAGEVAAAGRFSGPASPDIETARLIAAVRSQRRPVG